jgi:hypothetical protein
MPLKTRVRAIRTELQHRRTERLAHRRLSEELAAFQTPAERAELDQMLSRHSAEETRLIREILHRQDHERQRTMAGIGSSGYRA